MTGRKESRRFYVVHTLPMSDFCIYPNSGIPQELKGSHKPFKRTMVPSVSSLWKKTIPRIVPQVSAASAASFKEGLLRTRPTPGRIYQEPIYTILLSYPFLVSAVDRVCFQINIQIITTWPPMGNFDGFLMITDYNEYTADYNEYTDRMCAFCTPRFWRNASKTTGLRRWAE
jgi:hypothetical protein